MVTVPHDGLHRYFANSLRCRTCRRSLPLIDEESFDADAPPRAVSEQEVTLLTLGAESQREPIRAAAPFVRLICRSGRRAQENRAQRDDRHTHTIDCVMIRTPRARAEARQTDPKIRMNLLRSESSSDVLLVRPRTTPAPRRDLGCGTYRLNGRAAVV